MIFQEAVRNLLLARAALGVPDDRIYLDKGLTGTSRARPAWTRP